MSVQPSDNAGLPGLSWIIDAGAPGLALFGGEFEELVGALQASIDRLARGEHALRLGAPPVIPRAVLERLGYVEAFPHLLGTVYTFQGDDAAWQEAIPAVRRGEGWTSHNQPSDIAVLPAVCYHVYPRLAGRELAEPVVVDILGHCYRHESTSETGRMRSFRMRELVRVDTADALESWQRAWVEQARSWLESLGLAVSVRPANDPFFGSAQRLMGAVQRAERLKWELVAEVDDGLAQAVVSCNRHKDHFSAALGFTLAGSDTAHTGCTAFGLERIALAVLRAHGSSSRNWPAELRTAK